MAKSPNARQRVNLLPCELNLLTMGGRRISKNMLLLVYEPAFFSAIKAGIALLWNLAIIVPCPMVKHIYDTRSLLGS
jgi:hypothetical protein